MSATPSAANAKVLVIDDDKDLRYSLRRALAGLGHTVIEADSGETGVVAAKREQPDVILLDNRMGGMTGIETLQMLRGAQPQAMVILMTAFGTTQTAIEAMKFGAYDYVMKPFDQAKLITLVDKALSARRDLAAATKSTRTLVNPADYKEGIVGSSEPMQEVLKSIGQVAASDATVLITGESGTGKELVARCIHQHSLRAKGTFLAVNCAAIPENLIESELFGHEKGAFTGATNQKLGKFELCDGGTIFLDEIGDMSLPTQTKVLRAIQEGEIQRVGGTVTVKISVRLVAATNKDLEAMVATRQFREDLYYRLNVFRIRLPALQNLVNELAGQLANPVLQLLHTRRGEKGVDDAAQLGVQGRIGLVRQGGRLARVGRVVHRVAGKLVRLAQHVARQSGAGHHPVPTVAGGVEDVGAILEKLCHATVRAALQHR